MNPYVICKRTQASRDDMRPFHIFHACVFRICCVHCANRQNVLNVVCHFNVSIEKLDGKEKKNPPPDNPKPGFSLYVFMAVNNWDPLPEEIFNISYLLNPTISRFLMQNCINYLADDFYQQKYIIPCQLH